MLKCTPHHLDIVFTKMAMKKITGTIKTPFLYIGHALRTMFGLYQTQYLKEWDTALNELLDALEKGKVSAEIHNHCLRFSFEKDVYEVWVANRWHAYGNLYAKQGVNVQWGNGIPREYHYRPKFSTMIRLNDVVTNLEKVEHRVKMNQFYDNIRENLK
jgi:hypothetical protein